MLRCSSALADVLLRRAAVAHYFEHVLSLPLGFHLSAHSGWLVKIMTSGADAQWALWLGFFRGAAAAASSAAARTTCLSDHTRRDGRFARILP